MANYVTKFNINDTAYSVNLQTLNLEPVVITDIRIRQAVNLPSSPLPYTISYRGRTSSLKQDFYESDLYFLDEAKVALGILLSQRTSDIGSMH